MKETPEAAQPRVADPGSHSQPQQSGEESWGGWGNWGGSDWGRGWGYWYGQPHANYWDQWAYGRAWEGDSWSQTLRRPVTSDLFDCPETPSTRTPPRTSTTGSEEKGDTNTDPETPEKDGESSEVLAEREKRRKAAHAKYMRFARSLTGLGLKSTCTLDCEQLAL